MPHELFLRTRQTTKIRNAIAKNMPADIELSKAQLPKMIQSGGFLQNVLSNLGKKVIANLPFLFLFNTDMIEKIL